MNCFVKSIGLSLVLSSSVFAAKVVKSDYQDIKLPIFEEASFDDSQHLKDKKTWSKLKRKIASEMTFNAGDVSDDFQKIRDEWLNCKTGDEVEALLQKSHNNIKTYSPDAQYFLSQMHIVLPLRGIVWRLRPLFENSRGFLGNTSTHVLAIQTVRTAISSLKMFLPTKQTDAAIQYFTEPSVNQSKADQFKSVADFQQFLVAHLLPAINEASRNIIAITRTSSDKIFVWDNKMAFGRGTFEDDVQRFIGNGPAEMNLVISALSRAAHNILVYCAFNQEQSIKVAGEIGSHFGIDSSIFSSNKKDLGLTDEERVGILMKATKKHQFLELRTSNGTAFGKSYLNVAYKNLKNSVVYLERSFDFLQNREASQGMGLNPILFQQDVAPNIDKGIKNMRAVVSGPAEVRDPVTGDTVSIDLPAFYQYPPQNLNVLMATGFEGGDATKTITNKKGEKLVVRNYLRGRPKAWNNDAWKKYVPSSAGKPESYMSEARRIIRYSRGTSIVFGLPDMFVH